jgi:hypothetical protein
MTHDLVLVVLHGLDEEVGLLLRSRCFDTYGGGGGGARGGGKGGGTT